MAAEDDIKTVLTGDGTFTGFVDSSRVYTWADTGKHGISPTSTPTAYSSGFLQPCCVVRTRSQTPTPDIKDEGQGNTSYRAVVELWFYDDADTDGSTIESARSRALTLLQDTGLSNGGRVQWLGHVIENERDDSLEDAHMMRTDFEILATLS